MPNKNDYLIKLVKRYFRENQKLTLKLIKNLMENEGTCYFSGIYCDKCVIRLLIGLCLCTPKLAYEKAKLLIKMGIFEGEDFEDETGICVSMWEG